MQCNVQPMNMKCAEADYFIYENRIQIVLIQETWLTRKHKLTLRTMILSDRIGRMAMGEYS